LLPFLKFFHNLPTNRLTCERANPLALHLAVSTCY
jgi:hypothetical protein